jgi:hypothetical protein
MKYLEIAVLAALAIALMVIGGSMIRSSIIDDCKVMGMFRADGYTYKCEVQKASEQ